MPQERESVIGESRFLRGQIHQCFRTFGYVILKIHDIAKLISTISILRRSISAYAIDFSIITIRYSLLRLGNVVVHQQLGEPHGAAVRHGTVLLQVRQREQLLGVVLPEAGLSVTVTQPQHLVRRPFRYAALEYPLVAVDFVQQGTERLRQDTAGRQLQVQVQLAGV